jgi:CRP-like cAMP-binding protein
MRGPLPDPVRGPTPRSSASAASESSSDARRRQARAFFAEAPLTDDLEAEEMDVVVEAAERVEGEAGTVLLEEGDTGPALYFIETGTVEVLKTDEDEEHRFAIAELAAGDVFGEMSFVDDEPASATIRAQEEVRVWRLRKERLHDAGAAGRTLYYHLVSNVTHTISERLRATNTSLTQSLREKVEAERMRNRFGHFFITVIMIFGLLSVGTALLSGEMSPVGEVAGSWAYLLTFLVPVVYYYNQHHEVSLDEFGLTLGHWPTQVAEGVTCAAVLTFVMIPLKTQFYAGDSLFSFAQMQNYPPLLFWGFFALYLPHSFIQEFVARGLIQGSLHRFMADSAEWVPVAVAAFLFGIGHVHYSYGFAGLTFATSLLFGWLYLRHRSLLGVTLVHYLSGLSAMALGII